LRWIFFLQDKFEELLDNGFEHIELWESKHIRYYSYYVHFIKFKKKFKQANPHVLSTFLKPLMTHLKRLFVDGFLVQYAYIIESISVCMFDDLPSSLATLCAIVMAWTGDHLAECKVGGIRGVDVIMFHQDGVLDMTMKVWWNTMTIENIGGIHLPWDV